MSNARLSSLLKSCGAFEAFRKQESDDELRPERVVAFLLLERRLPRAVCFSLERALESIRAISGEALRPERAIGRVFAELAFTELHSLDETTELLLRRVQLGIADAADEIAAGYFTTRTVPPGPYAQQQAAAAAMILRVEHTTEFAYDGPIAEAYTELRLRPAEGGGQHCSSFRLDTEPPGVRVREYRDHFGNTVHHFDVLESHDRLEVTAVSEVWTPQALVSDRLEPTPLELHDYLRPTDYSPFAEPIRRARGRATRRPAS